LLFRIAAEKEQLALEHRKALDAQRNIAAELKDKLIQIELRHTQELKEAKAAGKAKLDEALKDFRDASGQLQKELEEETRLLKEAEDRNATLASDQAQFNRVVIQADELALSKFFFLLSRLLTYIFR
jgi:t-SNARE complex subunit (syntaxin)